MKAAAWTAGVATLAQAVLVLAKVTGHVDWRWGLVLFPLEALAAVAAATFVFGLYAVMSMGGHDCGFLSEEEEEDDGDR